MKTALFLPTLLALASGAVAQDFGYTARETRIPIRVERAEPVHRMEVDAASLELAIGPTRVIPGGFDSQWSEQTFGLDLKQPLADTWEVWHSTAAGFRRKDAFAGEAGDPALEQTFSLSQRGSLRWNAPTGFSLTGTAGSVISQNDAQLGFDDSVHQGVQVAWKLSAATTLRTDATYQQRYGLDKSIVHQDIYSAAVDHKLEPIPVTLRMAQVIAREDHRTAPEKSKDLLRFNASAQWQIEPRAAWNFGFETSDTAFAETVAEDFKNVYFTELKLEPTEALRVSMKTAYETGASLTAETPDLPVETDAVTFTLGLRLALTPHFGAGVSIRHRVEDRSASAPTYLSLFGSAYF